MHCFTQFLTDYRRTMSHAEVPYRHRKKRRKKRSVFVVARPLKMLGPLSFSCDGKFPLCHWGLFVSEACSSEITSRWEDYQRTRNLSSRPPRGTLFELVRLGTRNTHNKREDFGLEVWDAEWGYIDIRYVGDTEVTDKDLSEYGGSRLVLHTYSRTYHYPAISGLLRLHQQLSKLCSLFAPICLCGFHCSEVHFADHNHRFHFYR